MVASAFSENRNYESSFVDQTAQINIQLLKSVVKIIKDAAIQKERKTCLQRWCLNKRISTSVENITKVFHFCPFFRFLLTSPLKAAIWFMVAKQRLWETVQVNTNHQCQYYCSINNFKSHHYTFVSFLYKNAVHTSKEKWNILDII